MNSDIYLSGDKPRVHRESNETMNHTVITAFSRGNYTYFLGAATRPDRNICRKETIRRDIRLTRVCNADGTSDLESKIDITLTCEGFDG